MGLDTSHDCWHGAYSAFNRFRVTLAKAAGYGTAWWGDDGRRYIVRPGPTVMAHETVDVPRETFTWAHLAGDWDDAPPGDPLIVLLVHSDCDGRIPHRWCLPLAERLEEVAPRMEDYGAGHLPSPRAAALRFAEGLRRAHDAGEDVEFW